MNAAGFDADEAHVASAAWTEALAARSVRDHDHSWGCTR